MIYRHQQSQYDSEGPASWGLSEEAARNTARETMLSNLANPGLPVAQEDDTSLPISMYDLAIVKQSAVTAFENCLDSYVQAIETNFQRSVDDKL